MIWLIAGVILLMAEMPVPGVFLMWLGLAALGTGAVTLVAGLPLGPPQSGEVAVFAVLAAASVALGWHLRRPRRPVVNTPQSGLVGRTALALSFDGAEGRVRVGDSDWPARLVGTPPADRKLRVVAVEGTTLLVEAARHL